MDLVVVNMHSSARCVVRQQQASSNAPAGHLVFVNILRFPNIWEIDSIC